MSVSIKDFRIKESYAKLIYKALQSYFYEGIFKPMFDILDIKPEIKASNSAESDNKIIIEALKNEKIFYIQNEGFRAKNKFSNKISLILESWGAKYDKYYSIYRIDRGKIPFDVWQALAENLILQEQKIKAVESFLDETLKNLPYMVESMVFHDEVITILDDAGNEVKKNIKRINVIEPELTKAQKAEIAKLYTENMRFWVKGWAENEILEMRAEIQQLTLQGYRQDTALKMLLDDYGQEIRKSLNLKRGKKETLEDFLKREKKRMENKAAFLAQNETSIMLAEYKKVTYQAIGFDKFIWRTVVDGKERELHYKLNGTTWSWNDPPVIDERTLQKGLPGETYNCRCTAQPYTDDMPFKMHGQLKGEDLRERKIEINTYIANYREKLQERRAKGV